MHPDTTSTASTLVVDCSHGDGCPVHPGARSVHNYDPPCGQFRIHAPHLIAVVDFEGLTTVGLRAADVPVFTTSLCGGGLDPQHRATCGRHDVHGPHIGRRITLADLPTDGVAMDELPAVNCPGNQA